MTFRMMWVAATSALLVACGGGGDDAPDALPTAPNTLTVPGRVDLAVTGTGPAAHTAGATAGYTLVLGNAGPDAAKEVTLVVTADAGLTLGAITCAATGGATCPSTLGPRMTVPTLVAGGNLQFSVNATAAADATGSFGVSMTAAAAGDVVVTNNQARATANVAALTSIALQSDSGDFIGAGRSYSYSNANAAIRATVVGNRVAFSVVGDQDWTGDFVLPSAVTRFTPGTYTQLTRYPFHVPATGGLSWSGEGRGCNTLTGSMTVVTATYVGDDLKVLDLTFEQHCEGGTSALRGQVHWVADDSSTAPGPVLPVPTTLWQPAAGATPASGNYVYLASTTGDYIGQGGTYSYAPPTATTITSNGARLSVAVDGWNGDFVAMTGLSQLQPGYYGGVQRYPFHNPVKGGLSWSGNGRGCNTLTGWFAVDSVTYDGSTLKSIDLRFEQHCEGGTSALRGKIHWVF